MTEGGMFPWKIQRIFKLPVADYSRLRESLPAPPEGMAWVQNEETKEWRLVKAVPKEPQLIVEEKTTVAVPVTPDAKPSVVYDQLPPRCGVVDRLPQFSEKSNKEEDWEFLSDRISASSNQTPSVIIHRNTTTSGSVRSLTSMEGGGNSLSSHNTTLSLPFKIQRTASSSTIDSSDGALGPSGKGVLGVDYLEHVIMPTDTLQGICIAYKISSTRLRQANHFSGNSLLLAPKKLVIPLSKKALRSGFIRVQDTDAKEYKLHAILAEFPDLSMTEAKAYLELADWVLHDAIRSAKADGEWEREMDNFSLRSGEIRITPKLNKGVPIGFDTQGAGIQPAATQKKKEAVVTAYKATPAIATKSVNAQDVYMAVPQHSNFGLEMQPLINKQEAKQP